MLLLRGPGVHQRLLNIDQSRYMSAGAQGSLHIGTSTPTVRLPLARADDSDTAAPSSQFSED